MDWPVGVPAWLDGEELLWAVSDGATWRLQVGDELITPPGLQVRDVTSSGQSVIFTASDDPSVVEAWSWSRPGGLEKLTEAGGVSNATGDGPVKVVVSRSMSWPGPRATVSVDGSEPRLLSSKAEAPVVDPAVNFLELGRHKLRVASSSRPGTPAASCR